MVPKDDTLFSLPPLTNNGEQALGISIIYFVSARSYSFARDRGVQTDKVLRKSWLYIS